MPAMPTKKMTTTSSLTGSQLRTYNTIFRHPISHNLAWLDVHALFRHLGQLEEESNGNFKVLVSDFVQEAPQAWRNHGTRVLLENKPLQTMGYESLEDLERESRWLLTLVARKTA